MKERGDGEEYIKDIMNIKERGRQKHYCLKWEVI